MRLSKRIRSRASLLTRVDEVDLVDLLQGEEPLALARLADGPVDRVAGTEVEAAHLAGARRRCRPGWAGSRSRALRRKPKPSDCSSSTPSAWTSNCLSAMPREQGEDQVLLLQALRALDPEVLGHVGQLGDLHPLQVVELEDLHRGAVGGDDGRGDRFGGHRDARTSPAARRRVVRNLVQLVVTNRTGDGGQHRAKRAPRWPPPSAPLVSGASDRPDGGGHPSDGGERTPHPPSDAALAFGGLFFAGSSFAHEYVGPRHMDGGGGLEPTRQPLGASTARKALNSTRLVRDGD